MIQCKSAVIDQMFNSMNLGISNSPKYTGNGDIFGTNLHLQWTGMFKNLCNLFVGSVLWKSGLAKIFNGHTVWENILGCLYYYAK